MNGPRPSVALYIHLEPFHYRVSRLGCNVCISSMPLTRRTASAAEAHSCF